MIGRAGIISAASKHRRNPYAIDSESGKSRKNGRLCQDIKILFKLSPKNKVYHKGITDKKNI